MTLIEQPSATVEWYTPQIAIDFVEAVYGKGGIDLDPCADMQRRIPAKRHYTRADNGLLLPWEGNVFINPPYGREIGCWVTKGLRDQDTFCLSTNLLWLVPARTDTAWWHELTGGHCQEIAFPRGRYRFVPGPGERLSAGNAGSPAFPLCWVLHSDSGLLADRFLAAALDADMRVYKRFSR